MTTTQTNAAQLLRTTIRITLAPGADSCNWDGIYGSDIDCLVEHSNDTHVVLSIADDVNTLQFIENELDADDRVASYRTETPDADNA